MAQLNDSLVVGNLRVTDEVATNTIQITAVKAPASSGSTTYGLGTNGQVLKSNGTTVYWAADNDHTAYVALNQGAANAGKFLTVNSSGVVVPTSL